VRPFLVCCVLLVGFGAAKVPLEQQIQTSERHLNFGQLPLSIDLRQQLGQLAFAAALSGFRAIVADFVFIQAHVAWEQTEWGRVLLLFREATTLQPHAIVFWDMAAWHMGWNASTAALNDPSQPQFGLRLRAQRQYLDIARDFLRRGIQNNPARPQLYESMARLSKEKYQDHGTAAEYYAKAARLPGAPAYLRRFAAYELSYCEGREQEAYDALRRLYHESEQERLPTLIRRLKFLENKLNIEQDQRIPER
jgi:hypothetical protein